MLIFIVALAIGGTWAIVYFFSGIAWWLWMACLSAVAGYLLSSYLEREAVKTLKDRRSLMTEFALACCLPLGCSLLGSWMENLGLYFFLAMIMCVIFFAATFALTTKVDRSGRKSDSRS